MITANSFMKREFGKKLIEDWVPKHDLTHVIDTSGAYIPSHGTPAVILLGRHRVPVQPRSAQLWRRSHTGVRPQGPPLISFVRTGDRCAKPELVSCTRSASQHPFYR